MVLAPDLHLFAERTVAADPCGEAISRHLIGKGPEAQRVFVGRPLEARRRLDPTVVGKADGPGRIAPQHLDAELGEGPDRDRDFAQPCTPRISATIRSTAPDAWAREIG